MSLFGKKAVEEPAEEQDVNILKEVFSMIAYIAVVVLIMYLVITFVGQRTDVSGNSMNNTLYDGDSLWVDKLSYRFSKPERFDIVVFPYQDTGVYYVKRIIGLPGETVTIDFKGNIHINGEILEENYGAEVIDEFHIGRCEQGVTLGPDEYFVMGDNRNDSMDSRDPDVGNIKLSQIAGKVAFRMWPFDSFGKIPEPEDE